MVSSSSSVPLCFSLTLSQSADSIFEVQNVPRGWSFSASTCGTSLLVNDEEASGYTMVYGAPNPADPRERITVAVYFSQPNCDLRLINKATISDAELASWLSRVISADLAPRLEVDADRGRAAIRFAEAVEDLLCEDLEQTVPAEDFVNRVRLLFGDYLFTDKGHMRDDLPVRPTCDGCGVALNERELKAESGWCSKCCWKEFGHDVEGPVSN